MAYCAIDKNFSVNSSSLNNVFNKVKEGTTVAAKKVGKGITDLKIGDKLKVAGNVIAGAAKTSGHFIANTTTKAVHKTKEGMDILSEKTKKAFKRGSKDLNENPENKQNEGGNKTEEQNIKEEKKNLFRFGFNHEKNNNISPIKLDNHSVHEANIGNLNFDGLFLDISKYQSNIMI